MKFNFYNVKFQKFSFKNFIFPFKSIFLINHINALYNIFIIWKKNSEFVFEGVFRIKKKIAYRTLCYKVF